MYVLGILINVRLYVCHVNVLLVLSVSQKHVQIWMWLLMDMICVKENVSHV